MAHDSDTSKPSGDTGSRPRQPIPAKSPQAGIQAIHVNSAREMVSLHTRGRFPTPSPQTSAIASPKTTFSKPITARNPPIASNEYKVPRTAIQSHRMPDKPPTVTSTSASAATPSKVSVTPSDSSFSVSVPAVTHKGTCKNPQCDHCGGVIIPAPKLSFPIHENPSITVNNWSIFVTKKPILSSAELDHLADTKFEFPLPEMIFGNNCIRLMNEKTGTSIEFNTIDALDSLEDSCDFKVSYHKEWLKSRRTEEENDPTHSSTPPTPPTPPVGLNHTPSVSKEELHRLTDLESLKPYDWTYSPNYKGTIRHDGELFKQSSDVKIPIERLTRPDPILFFDEMMLFEDELGDNGISMFLVKIRVMPKCLLLLARFFLRIDNVAFRVRDTRVFIDLETLEIIREYKEQESDYDSVLRKVNGGHGKGKTIDPKGLLRDTNWVAQNIPVVKTEVETSRDLDI